MSLTRTVLDQYPGRRHVKMNGQHEVKSLLGKPVSEREQIELITGHLSLENPFEGCDVPRPEILTMIRQPISRVVSLYGHMKRKPEHHLYDLINENSLTIADMYTRESIEYDNFQTRMLAGLDCILKPFGTLDESDLDRALERVESLGVIVGLQEHYDASIALYTHHLGWDRSKIKIHQTNRAHAGLLSKRSAKEQYVPTESDFESLNAHNALDVKLYKALSQRTLSEIDGLGLRTDFPAASLIR